MKVLFRADASLQIGTGHIMRCLTLADMLTAHGVDCEFICRAHDGNLIEFIRDKRYVVHSLPANRLAEPNVDEYSCPHQQWLGTTQAQDAQICAPIVEALNPDWLIVDHYALDKDWESALAPHYRKLMVIDDLADRLHDCDLLLDQTLGRNPADYSRFVPTNCRLLCGSQYALLRPEFAALRPYSLKRRVRPSPRELLVTMGGVDKDNATSRVLQVLCASPLPQDCRITVVMGSTAPWLDEVRIRAQAMPWQTRVLVGVNDMAQLMADSDLAIGAGGATTWERCCLGLPSIMVVLADNQRKIAESLSAAGAAQFVELSALSLIAAEYLMPQALAAMGAFAANVTDGLGVVRVSQHIHSQG